MYQRQNNPIPDTITPRSFVALMDMYELNFIRLRRLCPQLRALEPEQTLISRLPGPTHDLHLWVTEQVRHTTTLHLTYVMSDGECRPDTTIRVYHDAMQAEVLSRACRVGAIQQVDRELSDTALLCRWKFNRFLFKWLGYCLRQGHSFEAEEGKPLDQGQENPPPVLIS